MANTPFFLGTLDRALPGMELNFLRDTLDSRVTFSRASATATYFDAAGVIQLAGINIPRFDHMRTAPFASRGLLMEEGRTNIINNGQFSGAVTGSPGTPPTNWTNNQTTGSISSITSGNIGENILTFTGSTTRRTYFQQIPVSANTNYSASIIVNNNPNGLVYNQIFDTLSLPAGASKTFYANAVSVTAGSYVPLTGDRLTIVAAIGVTAGNANVNVGIGVTSNQTGSVQLSKVQFELGAGSTSYIPTTTTGALARANDIAAMTGANFTSWFTSANGTLVAEGDSLVSALDTTSRFLAAIYDTTAYANAVRLENLSGNFRAIKTIATVASITSSAWTLGSVGKGALGYDAGSAASSFNAAATQVVTLGVPAGIITLGIGGSHTGINMLNGHVRRIRWFRQRLINAELQTQTK